MKKFIFVMNIIEVMERLLKGLSVEGVLRIDPETHMLTFKAYNRLPRSRYKEKLVEKTPWGWMKQSLTKTKRYSGMPNDLTLEEKLAILDKENELNKNALIEQELNNIEFC